MRKGFTLIELMLSIGIIAILSAMMIVAIAGGAEKKAQEEKLNRINSLTISK